MKKLLICLLLMLCLMPAVLTEDDENPIAPVLMLEGNRTTGYDWNWEVDHDGIVGIASEYAVKRNQENDGEIMPLGTGGCCSITLSGLATGEATITFVYRRPWEDVEPLYTLVYHIRVDEDLNVSILSSSFDW